MTVTNPGPLGTESELDGPAHRGDPLAEQRAMARAAAVVDRGGREVIAVSGPDRLSWLHLLLTQHVSELPPNTGTEALVLDANGRVLHHMVLAHVDGVIYLDTEPGGAAELLDLPAQDGLLVPGGAARRDRRVGRAERGRPEHRVGAGRGGCAGAGPARRPRRRCPAAASSDG